MKPDKEALIAEEPNVDATEEDIEDVINDETPAELPAEEAVLLLAGARVVEPPLSPPQANSKIHAINSSVRPHQNDTDRAIAILLSNPMWLTLTNKNITEQLRLSIATITVEYKIEAIDSDILCL